MNLGSDFLMKKVQPSVQLFRKYRFKKGHFLEEKIMKSSINRAAKKVLIKLDDLYFEIFAEFFKKSVRFDVISASDIIVIQNNEQEP